MEDAHLGHKLFADKLATDAKSLYLEDVEGTKHRILFNYTRQVVLNFSAVRLKYHNEMAARETGYFGKW